MGTLLATLAGAGLLVTIWLSYRFFMRGNTNAEKVASLLPRDFRPDLAYRKGDTYVGYEKEANRLVLIDWPHVKVVTPADIKSVEPEQEAMVGLKHHYLTVTVPDEHFPRYRIWFQFRPEQRNIWHKRLEELCHP